MILVLSRGGYCLKDRRKAEVLVQLYHEMEVALLAAARVVGVGEFEQFDGRAVFDYECDADAVGWAVRRNQDFAASKLGGEISHFKRDVRNVPDEIRDSCVSF